LPQHLSRLAARIHGGVSRLTLAAGQLIALAHSLAAALLTRAAAFEARLGHAAEKMLRRHRPEWADPKKPARIKHMYRPHDAMMPLHKLANPMMPLSRPSLATVPAINLGW